MKKITDSIESAIANVQTAFPSIYSKEDVVSILESLHAESNEEVEEVVTQQAGLTADQIEELVQLISEAVNRKFDRMDADAIIDFGSAEFSINYSNTVELESISFNVDEVSDTVNSIVDSVLTKYFENLIPAKEEAEAETETPYAVEQ